jgi:hypothetical protein
METTAISALPSGSFFYNCQRDLMLKVKPTDDLINSDMHFLRDKYHRLALATRFHRPEASHLHIVDGMQRKVRGAILSSLSSLSSSYTTFVKVEALFPPSCLMPNNISAWCFAINSAGYVHALAKYELVNACGGVFTL